MADVADTVAVVVQPGSGDVLQFLKAGIMEIPDVLVVNKADLGAVADRARRDLRAALRALDAADTEVVMVSCLPPRSGDRRAGGGAGRAPRAHRPARRGAWRPAVRTRSPTSPPSTASAGCGRWAGGAKRRVGWPSRTAAWTFPR